MRKIKIKTHYDPPPIPLRQFDWSAHDDNTYDGPGSPLGHGATEQEAIADLLEQIEEKEMTQRFMLARISDVWVIWDSEERMVVDMDWDPEELLPVVEAMNSLDQKLNHTGVN